MIAPHLHIAEIPSPPLLATAVGFVLFIKHTLSVVLALWIAEYLRRVHEMEKELVIMIRNGPKVVILRAQVCYVLFALYQREIMLTLQSGKIHVAGTVVCRIADPMVGTHGGISCVETITGHSRTGLVNEDQQETEEKHVHSTR